MEEGAGSGGKRSDDFSGFGIKNSCKVKIVRPFPAASRAFFHSWVFSKINLMTLAANKTNQLKCLLYLTESGSISTRS